MFKKFNNSLIYQSKILLAEKRLIHFFTTKHSDNELLLQYLNLPTNSLITTAQIHSDTILKVDNETKYEILNNNKKFEADAIITNLRNTPLAMFYADCVPIILYDKSNNVIGIIHAGWKGTLKRITYKTVTKLINDYNCGNKNILAAIMPSIKKCCYEVKEDLYEKFKQEFSYYKKLFITNNNKLYFNLSLCNYLQLKEVKIPTCNISVSRLCTYCYKDTFYSHRRNGENTGRMAAVVMIK